MSHLVIIGFDDRFKADEVLLSLLKLEQEHLIDLEDAVVVVKTSEGKIKLKPSYDLVAAATGKVSVNYWGKLVSSLILDPKPEAFTEIGLDRDSSKALVDSMKPDSSAIFTLVRKADPTKVIEELKKLQGKVLWASLPAEADAKLRASLAQISK